MDFYSFLRELADSWGLLALFSFFVGTALWILRPGASALHDEAARLPLQDDSAPRTTCADDCSGCTCAATIAQLTGRSAK